MIKTDPAVFAVGTDYQIMVPVTGDCMMWVKIGDECYCDEVHGIMRSGCEVHRITVPASVLNKAGRYTVCYKEMVNRKPFYSESKAASETEYAFYPVPETDPKIYFISDTHYRMQDPTDAALKFGKIDLLILGGDLTNDYGKPENFDTAYTLASNITNGNIPIVLAHGNHDKMGAIAERIGDFVPTHNGNTYYTFRINNIWGVVLDVGVDHADEHPEYGDTSRCRVLRKRETRFLEEIIQNAEREYMAHGVDYRLVICHIPFSHECGVCNMEKDDLNEWGRLLREDIKPHLMISGHLHSVEYHTAEDKWNDIDIGCPVMVCSAPKTVEGVDIFESAGFTFKNDGIEITVNNSKGEQLAKHYLKKTQ